MERVKNRFCIGFEFVLIACFIIFSLISVDSNAKLGKGIKKHASKEEAKILMIPLLLEITLNGNLLPGITQYYKDASNQIWVEQNDLRDWGMKLNFHVPLNYHQEHLYKLDWYPNVDYKLDQYAMQLAITAPARLFTVQTFDPLSKRLGALRPKDPGAFLNYDAVALRNNYPGINQTNLSGLMSLGLFNRLGVGTADVLAYNKYATDITLLTNQSSKLVR